MVQIKMVKNGTRTLIAIDGATPEQDDIVQKIITAYCCSEAAATALAEEDYTLSSISCVSPPKMVDDLPSIEELDKMDSNIGNQAILISSGEYQGMSPGAVLYKGGLSAMSTLFHMACRMDDGTEKSAIVAACKHYLRTIRQNIATVPKEQFIRQAVALYPPNDPVIQSMWGGHKDLDALLQHGTKAEIDHVAELLICHLEKRGR